MTRELDTSLYGLKNNSISLEQEEFDVVWPSMLTDDYLLMRPIEISFYRGDTRKTESGEWEIVPGWCGELEVDETTAEYKKNDIGLFQVIQENHTLHYVKNNYLVAEDVIAEEYGVESEARFERMPLHVVVERDNDRHKRWTLDEAMVNVRCKLTRPPDGEDTENVRHETSPDLQQDGGKKGPWKINRRDTEEELADNYRLNSPVRSKLGLKCHEVGTKSIVSYIYQDDPVAGSDLAAGMDWLDPEGVLFIPFDTCDRDNFKVTTEPSYEADAVDGKIIPIGTGTKVSLFWMPRRWAYYLRVAQVTKVDLGTVLCPVTYADAESVVGDAGCPSHNIPWDCAGEQNCGLFGPPGEYVDCSGGSSGSGRYVSVLHMCCKAYTCWGTFGGNPCGVVDGRTVAGDCLFPVDLGDPPEVCPSTITYERTTTYVYSANGYRYDGNHFVGLWWDSPPLDVSLGEPGDIWSDAIFKYYDGDTENVTQIEFSLRGDEGHIQAVAVANEVDEGLGDLVISGYTSMHYLWAKPWWTQITNDSRYSSPRRWMDTMFGSVPNFHVFEAGERWGYEGSTDDRAAAIWNRIATSSFYETYFKDKREVFADEELGFCQKDPWNDVPYGVAVSPAKEGTLCAVVKAGSKVFYVWRKTLEEFIERNYDISGPEFMTDPAKKPTVGFEVGYNTIGGYGWDFNFYLYEWPVMFTGTGRKLTHVLPDKKVNCEVNANDYGLTHDLEGEGCRGIAPFLENDGAGKIELEVPIYVMFSRERGLYDGPRVMRAVTYSPPATVTQKNRY